jgi:hypothetical protein
MTNIGKTLCTIRVEPIELPEPLRPVKTPQAPEKTPECEPEKVPA